GCYMERVQLAPRLALTGSSGCAIDSTGAARCWGSSGADLTGPPPAPPTADFTQVAAELDLYAALDNMHAPMFWSQGPAGSPVPAAPTPSGSFDQIVIARHSIACGLTSCGAIECWPPDDNDGLSNPPSGSFRQIAGGGTHACGIDAVGTLHCWGDDSFGQTEPPSGTFMSVTCGLEHGCAIASDGHVECWGAGSKLPNDTTDNFGQAIPPAGSFKSLSAGEYHTCGIASDDTVQCWGAGTTASDCAGLTECGQAMPPTGKFQEVAGNFTNSCGIRADGTLVCWGSNTGGRSTPPSDFK
ncbi:MAG TPA: hypothetical protein VGF76_25830, partial [Polyangiaceae bacterium]